MGSAFGGLEVVRCLKGETPWGVRLGVGSFLTMEFGTPEATASGDATHGEWHLWLYMCSWRIESADKVVMGSEDERPIIETALKNMDLGNITEVDVATHSLDLTIWFSSGMKLLTFSPSANLNEEQWKLFTPEGKCFTAYGDGSYEYTPINDPRPHDPCRRPTP